MDEILRFKAYLLRWYGNAHGLRASEAMDVFRAHGVLGYIDRNFEVLHSMSLDNAVADLDEYIVNH